jgi:hypothetical protein
VFRLKGRNFESKKPKERSVTCVVAAGHRENKSIVPERPDVHRIHVLHKSFHGVGKNAFATLSQSILRTWFRLANLHYSGLRLTTQRLDNDTRNISKTQFSGITKDYYFLPKVHLHAQQTFRNISIYMLPTLGKLKKMPEVLRVGIAE